MKKTFLISMLVLVIFSSLVFADIDDLKIISISLVNQDPDPAIAGDIVELRLGIENKGGLGVDNLILELVESYPFKLASREDAIQEVGPIKKYQSGKNMKIVKYKIKVNREAIAGGYELRIKEYEEGSSVTTEKSITLDIKSSESAEVIHIDKSTLIPGQESSLKFTINNVGNAPLREMTFYWQNEDDIILPVGSDNTKYVKYLDIGQSAELEYRVIADTNADPGLYKLDLYLRYEDPITSNKTTISTIAGIYVGGGTDFDVAFSESSAGETSFSIANIGSNPAYSVSVIIPKQQGWRVSGSNSMIVGNLNKGDYTVASFSLQSSAARTTDPSKKLTREEMVAQRQKQTPTQDTIKIQIDFTDTMGKRKTVEKEVSVNTQSITSTFGTTMGPGTFRGQKQQSLFSKYKWSIIGLVILIVGFIFYGKHKKNKLMNPKSKFKDLFNKKKR